MDDRSRATAAAARGSGRGSLPVATDTAIAFDVVVVVDIAAGTPVPVLRGGIRYRYQKEYHRANSCCNRNLHDSDVIAGMI